MDIGFSISVLTSFVTGCIFTTVVCYRFMKLEYIEKSKVLEIIEKGQGQLQEKETEIIMNQPIEKTEQYKREFAESIYKLQGGVYYLELLKKHFK